MPRRRCRDQLVVGVRRQPIRPGLAIEQVDPFDARDVAAERLRQRQQRLLHEQKPGSGVVEDVGQFGRREPDIEGQQDAVRFEHTVVRLEQAVAVGAEERHAVAAARPFGTQCPGQAGGAIGELGIGETLVAANDRHITGELLACVAKKPNRRERNVHVDLLARSAISSVSCAARLTSKLLTTAHEQHASEPGERARVARRRAASREPVGKSEGRSPSMTLERIPGVGDRQVADPAPRADRVGAGMFSHSRERGAERLDRFSLSRERIDDLLAGVGHAVHGIARVNASDVHGDRGALAAACAQLLGPAECTLDRVALEDDVAACASTSCWSRTAAPKALAAVASAVCPNRLTSTRA